MKKLLDCFDYIKQYHSDILDVVNIMLELFVFHKEKQENISELIIKAHKRKPIKEEFEFELREQIGDELYIPISKTLNILKVLKVIYSSRIEISDIEQFLHIISQKRTTNKLYYYSTPKEVNELLIMLLELHNGECVYNPCYGIGSIFLSIGSKNPYITLYGEELDSKLSNIAKLIARFSGIKEYKLFVNDILRKPLFKDQDKLRVFDKVICNPPLYIHMGIEQLKEDERFSKTGMLAKNYPELAFLTHALSHLKHRGVFIVRNQTLQKSFLEEKLRERLVQDQMLEAVIELPKNIFPHQSHDFSILIISHNNKNIFHINANNPHFFIKDGKYNQLVRIQEISELFKNKRETQYSKLTSIEEIKINDLRASYYLSNSQRDVDSLRLGDIGIKVFRGQRVYGSNKDSNIEYYDIGIADFSPCGFSAHFQNKKTSGDTQKIYKYRLQPYDILLSLRGIMPKMTILGENVSNFIAVANAGILTLRLKSKNEAIGLYCYFFSIKGFEHLSEIYKKSGENIIYTNELLDIQIPSNYLAGSVAKMQKIEELKSDFEVLEAKLERLKQS
ncbi:restriction endonuclease subunit M [Helicobacter muridarum]|uniref:site-specific DNA-methyltransferase (adenine-specific) n=1 Tax=Helicobacter muridarum TaxID=216 RepID=A0A099TXD1_9HELI|nr:N-6 DNA methylase [Helicobacter muridarum]TLE01340.1 restriction endonuclease subunit M [Helicobacter muridarum]STQ85260.1 type I restriction enzyme modification subunit [Helicobacter muridarum]